MSLATLLWGLPGDSFATGPFSAENTFSESFQVDAEGQREAESLEISDSQQEEIVEVSEVEKRACFSRAYEFGLGQSSPFQFYRLSADFHATPKISYGGYVALGRFGISDVNKTPSDFDSQVVNAGFRMVYFFSEELSWYLESGGGLGSVSGAFSFENGSKEDFSSTLLSFYGGLGYQKSYSNGIYWRYQLVGLGYTRPLGAAYGPLVKADGEFVEEDLTGSRAWAFVNLSVGIMY